MIQIPSFTMLILWTAALTAITTPLISLLYDPTKPYKVNKRRAIQYTPPNTELQILACIHDQESVTGFINLIEVSNPTVSSPFTVYALRLVELVGRATPLFIDHEHQAGAFEQYSGFNSVHNALKHFQESKGDYVKFNFFTTVSPTRTMYQDICDLALTKKATLIILPYRKECLETRAVSVVEPQILLRSVNCNVLAHAPCSVGVLVDNGPFRDNKFVTSSRPLRHRFAMLFLGGADAREAIAFADRMAGNVDVSLTVIRFLSHNNEGDNEMEKKLDDGLVTWFWVKNEGNKRVVYREVVVRNGEETVAAIRAMARDYYDLWIVGRKNGINPVFLTGLSNWSQNNELGVIGDLIASTEIGSRASVLVVQQQVLREQEVASRGLLQWLSRFSY
ncbi:hypothetical protein Vadar_031106 [Vaccinium darrowii]|uniref:Uncharacterized protein n=1 Tax=Vaccinium darrowii TaxID=229202 RepID=A0ACB7XDM4_9ERIC|nr:hypothetical protein Vadar_031106 [Vaccinium darrowii]